ncbi:MAG TPA: hypothetical protein VMW16_16410 [Sedimentisphaerales bacterium]|nr:hypothetical protein [Sedimentisphaerales bacterium]
MAKDKREIKKVRMAEEFRDCPVCGYADGFHNMFRKTDDKGSLKWYLICPQCSSIFDIGLGAAKG